MSREQWWNDTDGGNLKCSKKNLSQFYVIYHECHMDCTGIETVSFEDVDADV